MEDVGVGEEKWSCMAVNFVVLFGIFRGLGEVEGFLRKFVFGLEFGRIRVGIVVRVIR